MANDYGELRLDGKTCYAHRVAYGLFYGSGSIPRDVQVLHHCDNPSCVNPKHLFLGTARDNVQDAVKKGRHILGERDGMAKLTSQDVREIRARYVPRKHGEPNNSIALAKEYGVSSNHIIRISQRKRWGHLQ